MVDFTTHGRLIMSMWKTSLESILPMAIRDKAPALVFALSGMVFAAGTSPHTSSGLTHITSVSPVTKSDTAVPGLKVRYDPYGAKCQGWYNGLVCNDAANKQFGPCWPWQNRRGFRALCLEFPWQAKATAIRVLEKLPPLQRFGRYVESEYASAFQLLSGQECTYIYGPPDFESGGHFLRYWCGKVGRNAIGLLDGPVKKAPHNYWTLEAARYDRATGKYSLYGPVPIKTEWFWTLYNTKGGGKS